MPTRIPLLALLFASTAFAADPVYVEPAKKIAAKFEGNKGVVLHIGDSITYSAAASAWARYGAGQTDEDKAVLKWMHTNDKNDKDGWHLSRVDAPGGGRSETAASGIRADHLLKGGYSKLPSFEDILKKYKPQVVVLMIGTNDVSAGRSEKEFLADVSKMVKLTHDQHAILILSTIPPHPQKTKAAAGFNEGLRELAKEKDLPLIDYEKEILKRRPNDWNGTLLGKNDVHPSGDVGKTKIADAPTEENLSNSGYLLRCWLGVKKISEVKKLVIDPVEKK